MPNTVSAQQWTYADILVPLLLPKLDSFSARTLLHPIELQDKETNSMSFGKYNDGIRVFHDAANVTMTNSTSFLELINGTVARVKRFLDSNFTLENDSNSSSSEMNEVLKNLEYLENDPNAAFKPSSGFFNLLVNTNQRG